MSVTVDTQRALEAEDARSLRAQKVLEELLCIVKARRERLPMEAIAQRLDRGRATLYRREDLLTKLLALVESKGHRKGGL